jgi:hypothetical protein
VQEEEEERVWRRKKALAAPLSVVAGFTTAPGTRVSGTHCHLYSPSHPTPPRRRMTTNFFIFFIHFGKIYHHPTWRTAAAVAHGGCRPCATTVACMAELTAIAHDD